MFHIIYTYFIVNMQYSISGGVLMLNTKKIKKRYFIFLVFYILFGIALLSILDRELSSDFKQKYKIILFVIEVFFMNLPALLALIINNYIAKKTKNVEK